MKVRPARNEALLCNRNMKNKKLTYFLIFIVAGLWGLIIYKIVTAVGTKDDDDTSQPVKIIKEAFNDYSIPKDTTHLLLNYRDPFGVEKREDTVTKMSIMAIHNKPILTVVPKQPINWTFITYLGYIRNPASKKLVALVSINGQNLTMAEGDSRNQVKLLRNLKDSIKISYNGKTKFILMKSTIQ